MLAVMLQCSKMHLTAQTKRLDGILVVFEVFIINGFPFLSKVDFLSDWLNETKANQQIGTGTSIVRYRYIRIHMLSKFMHAWIG